MISNADRGKQALTGFPLPLLCCVALLGFSACGEAPQQRPSSAQTEQTETQRIHWNMQVAESGDRRAAELFARKVEAMSDGRLRISLVAAPQTESGRTPDLFADGTVQVVHTGIMETPQQPALQFFSGAPFGMTHQELGAWLYYGGGMELLEELYAPHRALPLPGGGVGMSLGGWFDRRLRSVRDLRGLKVQVSGLAAKAYMRLGSVPVSAPESGIYAQMRNGDLNAAVSPGPDAGLRTGLHTLGGYCYYPGWQAPGTMQLFLTDRDAFAALPPDLQTIVRTAAAAVDQEMFEHYNTRNAAALQELQQAHGTPFLPFPENLMQALHRASREAMEELAASDSAAQRVYRSYQEFFDRVRPWHETSDLSAMNVRQ